MAPPVAVVEPHELITVQAVGGEHEHDEEVGDEQADIEAVPAVGRAKRAIGIVRFEVVTKAVRDEHGSERVERGKQGRSPFQRRTGPILC